MRASVPIAIRAQLGTHRKSLFLLLAVDGSGQKLRNCGLCWLAWLAARRSRSRARAARQSRTSPATAPRYLRKFDVVPAAGTFSRSQIALPPVRPDRNAAFCVDHILSTVLSTGQAHSLHSQHWTGTFSARPSDSALDRHILSKTGQKRSFAFLGDAPSLAQCRQPVSTSFARMTRPTIT